MSIWVMILIFKSGAIEPAFAYSTEDKCKAEMATVLQAGKEIDLKAECRAYSEGANK